jgi:uncharacterized protein YigE (DUF2233 family)
MTMNSKRKQAFLLFVMAGLFSHVTLLGTLGFADDIPTHKWDRVRDGIMIRKFTMSSSKGNKVNLMVLRVEPSKYSAKVIDTVEVLGKQKRSAIYSLKEAAKATKPVVIMNGGFSASYSFPIPAGLLVTNGKEIKQLNTVSSVQNGVFASSQSGWDIMHRSKYKSGKYTYALQSGPLLIEPSGVVGIDKMDVQKHKPYRRSVLGIDKSGRLMLILSDEVNLYDLALFLSQQEEAGGLGCIVALNLSGDVESSIILSDSKYPGEYGNVDVQLASAIALFPK